MSQFLVGGEPPRTFKNIVVHPAQEMMTPAVLFRGGPEWPHFRTQISARHCRWPLPYPVDSRPHPAGQPVEIADTGIWCGPITSHFGVMIADFGMRLAASSRIDSRTPLVFSLRPSIKAKPPAFVWQMIDHLGIDRDRVMLIRKSTRFARLSVLPQAERRLGGGPNRRHLQMMDALTASSAPAERDHDCVFVSRARLHDRGRFAGESYLDDALAAAGVTVFHPETVDLETQMRLYRRARCLIFSEGSALHGLQLLGHLDADVVVLVRRWWKRLAAASLRPRARSLRYVKAVRGMVHGLLPSGGSHTAKGLSILDERRCLAQLATLGIDLAPFWDPEVYAARRDADVAAWVRHRLEAPAHPREPATIERRLRALSLS